MEIILGVAASGLVQYLKKKFGTTEYPTLLILALTALVLAFGFQFLLASGYWELVKNILITAGVFYTFILKRF